jgi:hypothetical protein
VAGYSSSSQPSRGHITIHWSRLENCKSMSAPQPVTILMHMKPAQSYSMNPTKLGEREHPSSRKMHDDKGVEGWKGGRMEECRENRRSLPRGPRGPRGSARPDWGGVRFSVATDATNRHSWWEPSHVGHKQAQPISSKINGSGQLQ